MACVSLTLMRASPIPSCAGDGNISVREARNALGNTGFSVSLHDDKASITMSILPTHDVRSLILDHAGLSCQKAHLSFFPRVERLCLRVLPPQHTSTHGIRLLEDPALLPALRFIDFDGIHLYRTLFSILASFNLPLYGPSVAPVRFSMLEDVLEARRSTGRPLQAIYLRISEEVALVRDGKIDETSCKELREDIVLESIERLEAVRGVEIVGKDFDIFVM